MPTVPPGQVRLSVGVIIDSVATESRVSVVPLLASPMRVKAGESCALGNGTASVRALVSDLTATSLSATRAKLNMKAEIGCKCVIVSPTAVHASDWVISLR